MADVVLSTDFRMFQQRVEVLCVRDCRPILVGLGVLCMLQKW